MSEERQGQEAADDLELDDFEQEPEAEDVTLDVGDEPTEEEQEPEAQPEAPTERRRRPGRDERQRAEIRRLREEIESVRRDQQRVQTPPQAPQVDYARQAQIAAYERDQLPLLPPDQQIQYFRQKDQAETRQALLLTQANLAERIDKSNWDAACRADRRRAQFSQRVDERLLAERRAGRDFDRETVYRFLLGDEIERQSARRVPQQRSAARARVAAQRTTAAPDRSDGARGRGRDNDDSIEALERRIFGSGKPIW